MKRKIIRINLVFLICLPFKALILLVACNGKTNNGRPDGLDTLDRPFPVDITNFATDSTRKVVTPRLGLSNIRFGVNGEQIRIWLQYSISDSGKVIVFNRDSAEWTGKVIYYKERYNKETKMVSIRSKQSKGAPKSGWPTFERKLKELNPDSLHNWYQIENYQGCMGGDNITLEIASQSRYDEFGYACYDVAVDSTPELQKIVALLNLIQQEFGFRLFPRPPMPIIQAIYPSIEVPNYLVNFPSNQRL